MSFWHRSPRPSDRGTPRLNLESVEARDVPSAAPATAVAYVDASQGYESVGLVTPDNGSVGSIGNIIAFPDLPDHPVTVAAGDVTGDGVPDLIAAAQNANGLVEVLDGATGDVIAAGALLPGFTGQVSVGAADLSGQGYDDVLIATSAPGLPVLAFDLRQGQFAAGFFALPGYSGPVSVTGTGTGGTGPDQILVGVAGAAGVFDPSGALLNAVVAFPGYTGPTAVAAGDVTGDGTPDIVVGAGSTQGMSRFVGYDAYGGQSFSSGPTGPIAVFDGRDLSLVSAFVPAPPNSNSTDGILVGTGDALDDGRTEVIVAFVDLVAAGVSAFDGRTGAPLNYPDESNTSDC